MIVYIALFLIVFSPVAIPLGIFHNALPTIIMQLVAYMLLVYKFRDELWLLLKREKFLWRFSVLTLILIFWGLLRSHNVEQYAVCIEHLTIIVFPVWIILMRQPECKLYIRFMTWSIFLLGFVKYLGEHSSGMMNYGGYTAILYVVILFFPCVSNKYKIFLCVFWCMSISYDITDRTHMIMMGGCAVITLLSFSYIYDNFFFRIRTIRQIGLATPIIVTALLFAGIFNVFKYSESEELSGFQGEQINVDTRSDIYYEIFNDTHSFVDWIAGKSYVGTYESSLAEAFSMTHFQRMGCEVGILEIFVRGGLLYTIIVFLLFSNVTRIAFKYSNNRLCKNMGLFVLLYWVVLFIELQMNNGMWNIALWMAFGIIMNPQILAMNDKEIKDYFQDVISIKSR